MPNHRVQQNELGLLSLNQIGVGMLPEKLLGKLPGDKPDAHLHVAPLPPDRPNPDPDPGPDLGPNPDSYFSLIKGCPPKLTLSVMVSPSPKVHADETPLVASTRFPPITTAATTYDSHVSTSSSSDNLPAKWAIEFLGRPYPCLFDQVHYHPDLSSYSSQFIQSIYSTSIEPLVVAFLQPPLSLPTQQRATHSRGPPPSSAAFTLFTISSPLSWFEHILYWINTSPFPNKSTSTPPSKAIVNSNKYLVQGLILRSIDEALYLTSKTDALCDNAGSVLSLSYIGIIRDKVFDLLAPTGANVALSQTSSGSAAAIETPSIHQLASNADAIHLLLRGLGVRQTLLDSTLSAQADAPATLATLLTLFLTRRVWDAEIHSYTTYASKLTFVDVAVLSSRSSSSPPPLSDAMSSVLDDIPTNPRQHHNDNSLDVLEHILTTVAMGQTPPESDFSNSKLTMHLQENLSSNTSVCHLLARISLMETELDASVSVLRFANQLCKPADSMCPAYSIHALDDRILTTLPAAALQEIIWKLHKEMNALLEISHSSRIDISTTTTTTTEASIPNDHLISLSELQRQNTLMRLTLDSLQADYADLESHHSFLSTELALSRLEPHASLPLPLPLWVRTHLPTSDTMLLPNDSTPVSTGDAYDYGRPRRGSIDSTGASVLSGMASSTLVDRPLKGYLNGSMQTLYSTSNSSDSNLDEPGHISPEIAQDRVLEDTGDFLGATSPHQDKVEGRGNPVLAMEHRLRTSGRPILSVVRLSRDGSQRLDPPSQQLHRDASYDRLPVHPKTHLPLDMTVEKYIQRLQLQNRALTYQLQSRHADLGHVAVPLTESLVPRSDLDPVVSSCALGMDTGNSGSNLNSLHANGSENAAVGQDDKCRVLEEGSASQTHHLSSRSSQGLDRTDLNVERAQLDVESAWNVGELGIVHFKLQEMAVSSQQALADQEAALNCANAANAEVVAAKDLHISQLEQQVKSVQATLDPLVNENAMLQEKLANQSLMRGKETSQHAEVVRILRSDTHDLKAQTQSLLHQNRVLRWELGSSSKALPNESHSIGASLTDDAPDRHLVAAQARINDLEAERDRLQSQILHADSSARKEDALNLKIKYLQRLLQNSTSELDTIKVAHDAAMNELKAQNDKLNKTHTTLGLEHVQILDRYAKCLERHRGLDDNHKSLKETYDHLENLHVESKTQAQAKISLLKHRLEYTSATSPTLPLDERSPLPGNLMLSTGINSAPLVLRPTSPDPSNSSVVMSVSSRTSSRDLLRLLNQLSVKCQTIDAQGTIRLAWLAGELGIVSWNLVEERRICSELRIIIEAGVQRKASLSKTITQLGDNSNLHTGNGRDTSESEHTIRSLRSQLVFAEAAQRALSRTVENYKLAYQQRDAELVSVSNTSPQESAISNRVFPIDMVRRLPSKDQELAIVSNLRNVGQEQLLTSEFYNMEIVPPHTSKQFQEENSRLPIQRSNYLQVTQPVPTTHIPQETMQLLCAPALAQQGQSSFSRMDARASFQNDQSLTDLAPSVMKTAIYRDTRIPTEPDSTQVRQVYELQPNSIRSEKEHTRAIMPSTNASDPVKCIPGSYPSFEVSAFSAIQVDPRAKSTAAFEPLPLSSLPYTADDQQCVRLLPTDTSRNEHSRAESLAHSVPSYLPKESHQYANYSAMDEPVLEEDTICAIGERGIRVDDPISKESQHKAISVPSSSLWTDWFSNQHAAESSTFSPRSLDSRPKTGFLQQPHLPQPYTPNDVTENDALYYLPDRTTSSPQLHTLYNEKDADSGMSVAFVDKQSATPIPSLTVENDAANSTGTPMFPATQWTYLSAINRSPPTIVPCSPKYNTPAHSSVASTEQDLLASKQENIRLEAALLVLNAQLGEMRNRISTQTALTQRLIRTIPQETTPAPIENQFKQRSTDLTGNGASSLKPPSRTVEAKSVNKELHIDQGKEQNSNLLDSSDKQLGKTDSAKSFSFGWGSWFGGKNGPQKRDSLKYHQLQTDDGDDVPKSRNTQDYDSGSTGVEYSLGNLKSVPSDEHCDLEGKLAPQNARQSLINRSRIDDSVSIKEPTQQSYVQKITEVITGADGRSSSIGQRLGSNIPAAKKEAAVDDDFILESELAKAMDHIEYLKSSIKREREEVSYHNSAAKSERDALETQFVDLQAQFADLQSQHETANMRSIELESTINATTEKAARATAAIEAERDALQSQLADLQAQYETSNMRGIDLESTIIILKQESARATAAIEAERDALHSQLADLQSQHETANMRSIELESTINSTTEEAARATAAIEAERDALHSQLADLQSQHETANMRSIELESTINATTEEAARATAAIEAERDALQSQLAYLQAQYETSNMRGIDLESTIIILKQESARATEAIEAERDALQSQLADLQSQHETANMRSIELESTINATTEEAARAAAAIEAERDDLQSQLADLQSQHETANMRSIELESTINATTEEAACATAAIEAERDALQSQLADLQAQYETSNMRGIDLESTIIILTKESARATAAIEAERDALQSQLADLQSQHETANMRSIELESTINSTTEEAARATAAIEAERDALQAQLADLQSQHETANMRSIELESTINSTTEEAARATAAIEAERDALQAQLADLQSQHETANMRSIELESTINSTTEEAARATAAIEAERDALQSQLADLQSQHETANMRSIELESTINSTTEEAARATAAIEAERDALQSQLADLQSQHETANMRSIELESTINSTTEEAARATAAIEAERDALQAQLADLQSQHETANMRSIELESTINATTEEAARATAAIEAERDALQAQLADLQSQHETANMRSIELESTINSTTEEAARATAAIEAERDALHSQLADLQSQHETANMRSIELESTINSTTEEAARATAAIEAERDALQSQLADLQSQHETANMRSIELESTINSTTEEAARATAAIEAERDALQAQLADLQSQHETANMRSIELESTINSTTEEAARATAAIEAERDALQAQLADLQSQHETANMRSIELESTINSTTEEAARATAAIEAERDALQSQLAYLQSQHETANMRSIELESTINSTTEEAARATAAIEAERDALQAQLADLQSQHETANMRSIELESTINSTTEEAARATAAIEAERDALQAQLADLQSQHETANMRSIELESTINSTTEEAARATAAIEAERDALQAQLADLQSQHETANMRSIELESTINSTTEEAARATAAIEAERDALQAQLADLQSQHETANMRSIELESTINSTTEEAARATAAIEAERDALQAQLADLQSQHETANMRSIELESTINATTEEAARATAAIEAERDALQAQLADLQSQHETANMRSIELESTINSTTEEAARAAAAIEAERDALHSQLADLQSQHETANMRSIELESTINSTTEEAARATAAIEAERDALQAQLADLQSQHETANMRSIELESTINSTTEEAARAAAAIEAERDALHSQLADLQSQHETANMRSIELESTINSTTEEAARATAAIEAERDALQAQLADLQSQHETANMRSIELESTINSTTEEAARAAAAIEAERDALHSQLADLQSQHETANMRSIELESTINSTTEEAARAAAAIEAERDALQSQLADLQSQHETANMRSIELESTINSTTEEAARATAAIEAERDALQAQLADLQSQHETANMRSIELESTINSTTEEAARATAAIEAERDALQSQLADLQSQHETANMRSIELESTINSTTEEAARATAAIEAERDALQAQLADLQSQHETANMRSIELESTINSTTEEAARAAAAIEAERDALHSQLADLQSQHETANMRSIELESTINSTTEEAARATAAIEAERDALQSQLADLQSQHETANMRSIELESTINSTTEEAARATAAIEAERDALQAQLADLQSQHETANMRSIELESTINATTEEAARAAAAIEAERDALQAQLADLQSQHETANMRSIELESTINATTEEAARAAAAIEAERDALQAQLADLQSQHETANMRSIELESTINSTTEEAARAAAAIEAERDALQAQLADLQSQHETANMRSIELESTINSTTEEAARATAAIEAERDALQAQLADLQSQHETANMRSIELESTINSTTEEAARATAAIEAKRDVPLSDEASLPSVPNVFSLYSLPNRCLPSSSNIESKLDTKHSSGMYSATHDSGLQKNNVGFVGHSLYSDAIKAQPGNNIDLVSSNAVTDKRRLLLLSRAQQTEMTSHDIESLGDEMHSLLLLINQSKSVFAEVSLLQTRIEDYETLNQHLLDKLENERGLRIGAQNELFKLRNDTTLVPQESAVSDLLETYRAHLVDVALDRDRYKKSLESIYHSIGTDSEIERKVTFTETRRVVTALDGKHTQLSTPLISQESVRDPSSVCSPQVSFPESIASDTESIPSFTFGSTVSFERAVMSRLDTLSFKVDDTDGHRKYESPIYRQFGSTRSLMELNRQNSMSSIPNQGPFRKNNESLSTVTHLRNLVDKQASIISRLEYELFRAHSILDSQREHIQMLSSRVHGSGWSVDRLDEGHLPFHRNDTSMISSDMPCDLNACVFHSTQTAPSPAQSGTFGQPRSFSDSQELKDSQYSLPGQSAPQLTLSPNILQPLLSPVSLHASSTSTSEYPLGFSQMASKSQILDISQELMAARRQITELRLENTNLLSTVSRLQDSNHSSKHKSNIFGWRPLK
ncbi:hypothetical protein BASA60_006553 [Batrachochytrium salamandrivorans]|nr:hypothetical protein BASA60_006553 [Batrachochytrium salamandrivorans]